MMNSLQPPLNNEMEGNKWFEGKKGMDSLHLHWSKEINTFLEVNKAKILGESSYVLTKDNIFNN
jgi:hypothetical protein